MRSEQIAYIRDTLRIIELKWRLFGLVFYACFGLCSYAFALESKVKSSTQFSTPSLVDSTLESRLGVDSALDSSTQHSAQDSLNQPTSQTSQSASQPSHQPYSANFGSDIGITSDRMRAHTSLLRLKDIDLASFSSIAQMDSTLFRSALTSGYSALFTKISLESARFGGFYLGATFSAIGKIADFAQTPITREMMQEDPRIYSLLINNDEAKDLFYTSDAAHMPALFLSYEHSGVGVRIGRYDAEYEWIGDYVEGGEVYANVKGVRFALGGFYRQTYANPAENTRYGYIKNLYERYQGYAINKHFYADANYQKEDFGLRVYANYFASLYAASGIATRYEHDFNDEWNLGMKAHATFVSAGVQESSLCPNPHIAEEVGLACYQKGSFGERNGGVIHLEGLVGWKYFHLSFGGVINDKNRATDLLPIYADNNPLEYNTYIYGEQGRTGYVKLDYRGIMLAKGVELGGFVGVGRTMFFAPDKHFSNQAVGEIELDFTKVKWHLTLVYLDEVLYSKTLVGKLWIGYKF